MDRVRSFGPARRFHFEQLQSGWQLHLHKREGTVRAQGTARMKVHILRALPPPAEVSENALLPDGARERLDGGASMLVLARINNRLWSQSVQDPVHSPKLRGR